MTAKHEVMSSYSEGYASTNVRKQLIYFNYVEDNGVTINQPANNCLLTFSSAFDWLLFYVTSLLKVGVLNITEIASLHFFSYFHGQYCCHPFNLKLKPLTSHPCMFGKSLENLPTT